MRLLIVGALLLAYSTAWATDPPKPSPTTATADADATAAASATGTGGNASSSNDGVHVESERQAPSTLSVAPQATAPCYFANGWSVGVPGAGGGRSKSRKDAECWAEYVKQAEHERALDVAKLDLERERVLIERDRLKLESLKLDLCQTCEVRK